MQHHCKNCNQQYQGNFCNHCGQSVNTHDINAHFIWHDIQHGLFHFDKGIFFTIKELFIRPGKTIREFIEGKRVKHFKPISFVIFIAGLYGFLMHYLDFDSFIKFNATGDQQTVLNLRKITEWAKSHYALTTLISIPVASFASYLAFRKQGYNYIQHVVLNCYLSGFKIVLRIIFFPFLFLVSDTSKVGLLTIPDVIGMVYGIWAFFQFFSPFSKGKLIGRLLLYYLILGLLYILLGIVLSGIIFAVLAKMNHGT